MRGRQYTVDLSTNGCAITTNNCTVHAPTPFAVNAAANGLEYFPGQSKAWALSVTPSQGQSTTFKIASWPSDPGAARRWTETGKGKVAHLLAQLKPNATYQLKVNGKVTESLRADNTGVVKFAAKNGAGARAFEVVGPSPSTR